MSEPPAGKAAAKALAAEPDAPEQAPDSLGDKADRETATSPSAASGVSGFGAARRWIWLAAVAAVLGAGVLGGLTLDATTPWRWPAESAPSFWRRWGF